MAFMHADRHLSKRSFHIPLYFHSCCWHFRDAMGRSQHWRLVAKRAVLGDWRCLLPSLCRLPGPAQGSCWSWNQLHCHIQRRRWWRFCWPLPLQVDHLASSSFDTADTEHNWYCGRDIKCYQQWLWVMGATFWQALFRHLGYRPSLSFPQGNYGEAG